MTLRPHCRDCADGRCMRDHCDCEDGTCEWCTPATVRPTVALVCGHTVRAALSLTRQHCFTCGFDVEVVDAARLDEQRERYARQMEKAADELEVAPMWGWPEPSKAEQARLHEQRIEALIRMRRVAGAMRARVGEARRAA